MEEETTCWRVRDWDRHFENNRTRELKKMDWVPFPNKHDGDGFTELLDHQNGVAHYGSWCLIVEIASKCDPRGTLLRDSAAGPKPHDFESLARVSRSSAKIFEEAIPRLISIGWLEVINPSPIGSSELSRINLRRDRQNPAGRCGEVTMEGKGRERNGTEEKEVAANGSPPASKLSDEDWLADLAANATYGGIDVRREHGKMCAWCATNRRQPTRRRFVNWLNRCEKPMAAAPGFVPVPARPATVFELKTIIEAKRVMVADLERKFSYEVATGREWKDVEARKQCRKLLGEIKELNAKIGGQ